VAIKNSDMKSKFYNPAIILIFVIGTFSSKAQNIENYNGPIIDMHLHSYAIDPSWDLNYYWLPEDINLPESSELLLQTTLEELKRHNIVKAWSSGPLEVALTWKKASPDVIFSSPDFNWKDSFPSIEKLRTLYKSGEMDGLGELVAQLAGLTQSDEFFEPYLQLAEELDKPVCFHSGFPPPGAAYKEFPKSRAHLGSPFGVEDALVKHPKLRPFIAHGGYPFLEETIAVLHAHPQLYLDISEINWLIPRAEFHEYLSRLIESGFGNRLMYGSDQMFWPEAIGISIEAVDSAPFLSQEQKEDIFYNNAARFLKLSEEQITKHYELIKATNNR
jgi:uncharacterized protein